MATGGVIGRTNHYLYNKESVLIGRKGTIDKPKYMNTPFWTVDTLFYSEIKKGFNAKFIYNMFQKINWRKYNTSTGVPSLTSGNIESIKVKTPKYEEEQRQIGLFFNKIDDLIDLKGNKIEILERLKGGYLQKLFINPYEDKPKLHFKKFKDDWKTYKLDELINWQRGKDLSKKELNVMAKGNKVVHYADLYKFGAVQDKVLHWSLSNQGVKLPDNSLLFPMSDVTPSGLATTTYLKVDNVKIGSDILVGTIKNECASFLSYEINKNKNEILKRVTGTTVRHINSKALGSIKVSIPNYEEQSKIGTFMALIDKQINIQKQELNRLKSLKKGYLQKMFV